MNTPVLKTQEDDSNSNLALTKFSSRLDFLRTNTEILFDSKNSKNSEVKTPKDKKLENLSSRFDKIIVPVKPASIKEQLKNLKKTHDKNYKSKRNNNVYKASEKIIEITKKLRVNKEEILNEKEVNHVITK